MGPRRDKSSICGVRDTSIRVIQCGPVLIAYCRPREQLRGVEDTETPLSPVGSVTRARVETRSGPIFPSQVFAAGRRAEILGPVAAHRAEDIELVLRFHALGDDVELERLAPAR